MNLTAIIHLKEKIATTSKFTPQERDFILEAMTLGIEAQRRSNVAEELMIKTRENAALQRAINVLRLDGKSKHKSAIILVRSCMKGDCNGS